MTEYGRGPGSEPWHPEDPLYGDQGWEGRQQYPHPQQASPYEQGGHGHQDPYAQGGQGYGGDPYQQHEPQAYADPQYQQQHYQPQYRQQQPYDQQQYQQQYGAEHQGGYDTPEHLGQQYDGSWESGQAAMAYGAPPADPYGGQNPDLYGTPEAYPPPRPPGHRQDPPEPVADWAPEEEPRREPEPEEENHPFFTGGDDRGAGRGGRDDRDDDYDDAYDEEPARGRGSRGDDRDRRGKDKKRKGKNGVACLVVAVVLVGGVGGVGYFGYQFWQGRFAEVPDYAGSGSGEVQVEIPKGSYGSDIGNILKKAGVVKSVDAFTSAQLKNPKGNSIQAGVYTLKKEMSAESAVTLMLDPASQANLVIPEGKRNVWVYETLDQRLDLKPGTTKEVALAKADSLGLPEWAKQHPDIKDPLEGFLFPASYPVAKGGKPEDALRKMVARANQEYGKLGLDGKAKAVGLKGPWELLTVASLVQVEGKYKHDFDKVARVVYNRLKPGNMETVGRLEFDSTVNYLKGQSTLDVGTVEDMRKIDDPYNTYKVTGLVPGPISNPGMEALQSAISPAAGPWYYFVSINEDKTVFSVTNEEHNRNVAEYEKQRKQGQ